MSETIEIKDMNAPVLSNMQQGAIDFMEGQPTVALCVDDILQQAKEKTGKQDFGDLDFIERLQVQIAAVEEDEGLNQIGRLGFYNDCVRYAANRLLLEDLLKKHPDIHDVEIKSPIIVAGLPRSGTTHLLNLMAADSRLRSVPYWESKEPLPLPGEQPTWNHDDPRYQRCLEHWALQDQMMPLLKSMHEMSPDHVHEELELENMDFSSYNLEWLARPPQWRDYYLAHDQTAHYAYMKKALKALQWLRQEKGGDQCDRWVLKCPQHLEQLPVLKKTFPDAFLVMTHRDPVEVISSIVTMLGYGDRLRRYSINAPQLAEYWIDRVERLLKKCVAERNVWPAQQSLDLPFKAFMQDDVAAVEDIYRLSGLGVSEASRAELQQYLDEHPRGKHGRMAYRLEEDFQVSIDGLRERFSFYYDAFDVSEVNSAK